MDGLAVIPWDGVGLSGLVALAIVSVMRGWLIPRSTHVREVGLMQQVIDREIETNKVKDQQLDTAIDTFKSIEHMIRSIKTAADSVQDSS